MDAYHLRRHEKEITAREDLLAVIEAGEFMTLAMCRENEPYLVSVNYAFDPAGDVFWFHCASEGKKTDILRANPRVWGQVVLDDGYLHGNCDHAFRSVHFSGTAEFVTDQAEMLAGLALLVDQLEDEPEPVKERSVGKEHLDGLTMVRIRAEGFTGKRNA